MFYSISNKNFIKRIVIQKQDNSCVSSSVAHGIAILMNRLCYNSFFPSILFIYYNGREEKEKDNGAYIEDIFKGIQKYGIVPENLFPYEETNLLIEPPTHLYQLSKEFQIHFSFQKFNSDTIEQYTILDFIREHLWNGDLIIADIKQDGNLDHTILIYGIDEKNKILLCHDPQNEIMVLFFDDNVFDKKDLYAINCQFPNKIPNFILENDSIEKEKNNVKNIIEPTTYEIHSLSKKFDYIITGGNIKSSLCSYFLKKNFSHRKILLLDNNTENLIQMNHMINDIKYGSYESLNNSSIKYLYETNQDFNIFLKKTNEHKLVQSLVNDILKPLGLDIHSENLNYQIVYCKKLDTLKLSSFQDILKENITNIDYLQSYYDFIDKNFKGLDLSLPYYVVLNIIVSPLLSRTKLYIENYKSFLEKFLPKHDKIGLGTFLMFQPSDNFIYLYTNYQLYDENKILLFQGSSPETCYSDNIEISFNKLYTTNNFYPIKDLHFEPILKMDLFFICSEEKNNEIMYNNVYKNNIIKITLYGKEVHKIISNKPSTIYMNILYDISNYKELETYCIENKPQGFLLHPSNFSYPITNLPESLIIKKSFGLDNTIHNLNTNFLGSSDIIEYNLNIVELMIYFLIDS